MTLVVVAAYLLGSIPFALMLAHRWGAGDLRRLGSGNVGAANVVRVSGATPGVLVALLDIGKGAASVFVAARMSGSDIAAPVAGLAAIVGHIYPVFLLHAVLLPINVVKMVRLRLEARGVAAKLNIARRK